MELYPHQQAKLDRNTAQCLIPYGTGTGKTITALELAQKNNVDCLIICPKAQKKMWERNCANYPQKHFIMTKEEFKRLWFEIPRYEGLIVDEAHHFSGQSSTLSKILERYINKYRPQYRWLLTATPYRSTPWNIQRLATFLNRQMSYPSFMAKYFYKIQLAPEVKNKLTGEVISKEKNMYKIRVGIEKDIADWVRELADDDVVKMKDVADVPTQTIEPPIFVTLTEDQKEGIMNLEDTVFISRFTHMHCIENGILSGDGYVSDKVFENKKMFEIHRILHSGPDRFAIFCRYNAQIEYYKTEIESFGFPVFIINGDVKDRDARVAEIEAHQGKCVVLIQAQCSEGYELPSISHIIFASLSWSYLDYVQAQGGESGGGRFLRINKLKPNWYYHIVVKGGVDEDIYNCIMQKQNFDEAIYDKRIGGV